jgi:mannose-1-phosphate guanylyltransferase/mannose-6-phosphate isomerase
MTSIRLMCLEKLFSTWLYQDALPFWSRAGVDRVRGGFHVVVGLDGLACELPRRARVQGRQSFTFACAGKMGWSGSWLDLAEAGITYLDRRYRAANGLYQTTVSPDGAVLNSDVMTYDQAFALLAMAGLYDVCRDREDIKLFARALMYRLCKERRNPGGGFWEFGDKRYLSNPQMHIFEAVVAWSDIDQDAIWVETANEIADLAAGRFIDPTHGVLFEIFDENWTAVPSGSGSSTVEPGHQYEWAWLLKRWSLKTGRAEYQAAAEVLLKAGQRGIDPNRNVAIDEVDREFKPLRTTARLWPQTERLKAVALFLECAEKSTFSHYENEVVLAAESLWRYLDVPLKGFWRDKMRVDGSFVDEPAPASSFYHIILAVQALTSAASKAD